MPNFLFFDCETTGVPKNYKAPVTNTDNWPRVVQLACALYSSKRKPLSSLSLIIKPSGFLIPDGAARIHGIHTETAEECGVSLIQALVLFQGLVSKAGVLVAHNLAFDAPIIGAEFLRCNLPDFFDGSHIVSRICTMLSSTDFCRLPGGYGGYKWPKLSELHAALFGCDFEGAHDAMADVNACARCFFKLVDDSVIVLP